MIDRRWIGLAAAVLLVAAGCEREGPAAAGGGSDAEPSRPWRYHREYVFVGERGGEPLVAPFAFRAVKRGERVERSARAWLAHGRTWDGFLEERWSAPRVGGVWRVLPHGELRAAAGGSAGLEALWYRSGERSLRLRLEEPLSPWEGGERERFRLVEASLALGPERLPGLLVEELVATRAPAPGGAGSARDRLFLVGRGDFQLYLSHATPLGSDEDPASAFALLPGEEQPAREAELHWLEATPVEQARRDIPLRWSFSIPGSGIRGEVEAMGYETSIGEERGGRRAVEVRYTVQGWLERDGDRVPVHGSVRHEQG